MKNVKYKGRTYKLLSEGPNAYSSQVKFFRRVLDDVVEVLEYRYHLNTNMGVDVQVQTFLFDDLEIKALARALGMWNDCERCGDYGQYTVEVNDKDIPYDILCGTCFDREMDYLDQMQAERKADAKWGDRAV